MTNFARSYKIHKSILMKKILLPLLAVAALAACKKPVPVVPQDAPMTVEITIANGSVATKGVTSPAANGAYICDADDLTAIFADADGNILSSAEFPEATNGKYTFGGLTTEVSKVAVIALRDNTLDDINTLEEVKAIWATEEQMDAEADALIAYGEDLNPVQSTTDYKNYVLSATVRVMPNHSRIEVTSIACTDFGDYSALDLKILGLDEYEVIEDLTGNVLNAETTSVNPDEGKVWSWNLLGQKTPVVDMILGMEVVGNGYTVVAPERILTINSYKVNGVEIENFEAGNVYKFAIKFGVDKLWGDSNVSVSADVTVEIDRWIVNETEIGFAD